MENRTMKLYGDRVFGAKVSGYGLENGYLDYRALSELVGEGVMNNNIFTYVGYENWELECGLEEDEDGYFYEIYQYFIITDNGANFLKRYTDELVFYNEELDMYIWGVTHFGTSWDYVLTDIKLIKED